MQLGSCVREILVACMYWAQNWAFKDPTCIDRNAKKNLKKKKKKDKGMETFKSSQGKHF